jgi:hypothetical protein
LAASKKMKEIKFILSFFITLSVSTTLGQDIKDLVTERVIYTVRLDDTTKTNESHFPSNNKKDIINTLCDLVHHGKLDANSYWGEIGGIPSTYRPLREKFVKMYFFRNDSLKYDPDSLPYENRTIGPHRNDYVYRYLINSLSFNEKWYFDEETNTFTKKVAGVFLVQDEYTHNIGMKESYYLPLNDTNTNNYDRSNLLSETIIYDVPITKENQENCSDYNWWHNYLEASNREKLLSLLTYKALRDTITGIDVYVPTYPFDSLLKREKYVNHGINKIYYGRSNWYSGDPLMFGMTNLKIQACCTELSDWTTVRKIRFHEEWYFDSVDLRFEKKVLGIGLIVDTYNEEGEITGEECLVYYELKN